MKPKKCSINFKRNKSYFYEPTIKEKEEFGHILIWLCDEINSPKLDKVPSFKDRKWQ